MTRNRSIRATIAGTNTRHVSLLAIPDAVLSTLSGVFDVMNAFAFMTPAPGTTPTPPPFTWTSWDRRVAH